MKTFIAAVDVASHRIQYGGWHDTDIEGPQYDVEPGLSSTQVRVVFNREPDKRLDRHDPTNTADPTSPDYLLRSATVQEIGLFDIATPKMRDVRVVIRSLGSKWPQLRELGRSNGTVQSWLDQFLASPNAMANVHEPLFLQGAAECASAAVTAGIFASIDEATAALAAATA